MKCPCLLRERLDCLIRGKFLFHTLDHFALFITIHYLILIIIRGIGLSLKDKYGETTTLSTASVGCLAPVISSDHTNAGFIWMVYFTLQTFLDILPFFTQVKYHNQGGQKHLVFVPQDKQDDPKAFHSEVRIEFCDNL